METRFSIGHWVERGVARAMTLAQRVAGRCGAGVFSRRVALVFLVSTAASLSGCFVTDGLTEGKTKPARVPAPAPAPAPVRIVPSPEPDKLAPPQLARRLSLDLLNRLPAAGDTALLAAGGDSWPHLIDSYLASGEANRALAEMHPRMWRLRGSLLPDLDLFAATDPALAAALTPAVRADIVREPALAMRLLLDRDDPLPQLFTSAYTILSPAVAALYGLDTGEAPWPGEPYVRADYGDGRPAGGVLVQNGVLASFAQQGDADVRNRSARLLTTFGCYRTEAGNAHLFYDLSADELNGDLRELAATRAPCVSCHAQFHEQAGPFAGLGVGSTFTAWRRYSAPTASVSGRLPQGAFNGMEDMAALIGEDTRTQRCEVERLLIELYQRRTGPHDSDIVADGLTEMGKADARLKPAIRKLLTSSEYAFGPVPGTLGTDHGQVSTGVRVLKRQQWLGVLRQLSYKAGQLTVPEGLEPGLGEVASDLDHVPSGTYFHDADRLVRQAATAIVDEELEAGVTAATRRVFTVLPDGAALDEVGEAVVREQVKAIWTAFTGQAADDTTQVVVDLVALWAAAADDSGGGAEDQKRRWRTVLVAVMTHPAFLTY